MADIQSLDLAELENNPTAVAEAVADLIEVNGELLSDIVVDTQNLATDLQAIQDAKDTALADQQEISTVIKVEAENLKNEIADPIKSTALADQQEIADPIKTTALADQQEISTVIKPTALADQQEIADPIKTTALADQQEISTVIKPTALADQETITNTLLPQAQTDSQTLSDLIINLDDMVAQEVNNALSNLDFNVTDRSDKFTEASGWSKNNLRAHSFNGFMFFSFTLERINGTPSHTETCIEINDSNFYPLENYLYNTVSYQGDLAYCIQLLPNGIFRVLDPDNAGGNSYYVVIGGYYRFQ